LIGWGAAFITFLGTHPLRRSCSISILVAAATVLAACQTSNETAAIETAAEPVGQEISTENQIATDTAMTHTEQSSSSASGDTQTTITTAQAQATIPAQCTVQLAAGPPQKPPRGRDFGQAVAKNTGKAVQRGIIQQLGGAIGGGLGAAVAGNVAAGTIRQEEDIKGVWMITDGTPSCACEISVDSLWKLKGKGADSGFSKNRGCANPNLQQVAAWTLGYSFTGYDSKFELKAKDKKTLIATLKRDGIHYFSGNLASGTSIVMWRNGQTFHQLQQFNKSVK